MAPVHHRWLADLQATSRPGVDAEAKVGFVFPDDHAVDALILAVLSQRQEAWCICALENVTLANPRTGEAVLRG